ncbi:MAG: response regulator [Pseudomonadales bacterium]|nr:response regulator [Pseudomonadales bacterium]
MPRGSEHILVVEDDEGVLRLVVRMLERAGFKVSSAKGGEDALKIIREGKQEIDLLLTDIVMAQMSGTELAMHVREAAPDVRVLFMSGYADDMVSFTHDMIDHPDILTKPFTASRLTRKVRETLDAT